MIGTVLIRYSNPRRGILGGISLQEEGRGLRHSNPTIGRGQGPVVRVRRNTREGLVLINEELERFA